MIENGDFSRWVNGLPAGWRLTAQRDAIRPGLTPEDRPAGGRWAVLSALPSGLSMGWLEQPVDTAKKNGQWLRFSCVVRTRGGQSLPANLHIVLDWKKKPDVKGWMPTWEFPRGVKRLDAHTCRVEHLTRVPDWAKALTVRLGQYGGVRGDVAFADVRLTPAPAPARRTIRIAAAYRPPVTGGWERTSADVERLTAAAAAKKADLILFGEGLTVVGTGKTYADVAQPVPGPATEALAASARKHRIFLAAGLYERDGEALYNTAVLLDREGRLVGKYRKTHLPYSELAGGLQPGTEYPVFDTELGLIGIQICYDHFFPECARSLALNGAEIILTPIWGDVRVDGTVYEAVARSRAIDNAVVYVTSIYAPLGSLIIDPLGRVLARTPAGTNEPSLAVAEVDLDLPCRPDAACSKRQAFPMNFLWERRPGTYGACTREALPPAADGCR